MAAVRRGAWVALRYVTTIFFLGVVVQFFLVGYGLFAMKHGATIDNAKLARLRTVASAGSSRPTVPR